VEAAARFKPSEIDPEPSEFPGVIDPLKRDS
jgi:hypothetical protein